MNREDFFSIARYQGYVTKQPLYSELIKALQYNRTVCIAGKKPRSSSLARLQVGRDAHVAVTERHLHGRTRSSQRAAGRRRYKENALGKRGAAERRASERSPQHRSGHPDVRLAAAPRTSNLTGERVSHHLRQLRDRFTSSGRDCRPSPRRSGRGRGRHGLCTPAAALQGSAPQRAVAASSAVLDVSPRSPTWLGAGPGIPTWA